MDKKNLMLSTPINDAEFFVFDVETTGLSSNKGGQIVEIGAAKVIGGAIVETFSSLVKPTTDIEYGAFKVHGISYAMLENAPSFSQIAEKLSSMTKETFLTAYNAPFDVGFLKAEMERCNCSPDHYNIVDVLPLARRMILKLSSYKLGFVAEAMHIPFPVRHRAMEDAIVTAQLLMEFCRMTKENGGKTISDLITPKRFPVVSSIVTKRIEEAVLLKKKLSFVYQSANTGKISNRIVTPQKLEQQFLTAFCDEAKEQRMFRIDRITEIAIVSE